MTIIGVIAALTIPTLMKNYEKRQIEVGLAKTYQELSNVMKRSEVDNGEVIEWDSSDFNDQVFPNKYIEPYIKLIPCNGYSQKATTYCFKEKGWAMWKLQPNKAYEGPGSYIGGKRYKLNDGRSIAIFPRYDSGRDWRSIEFVVDVNGDRGNSVLGEDVFRLSYIDYIYASWAAGKNRYRGLYAGGPENGGMVGPYFSRESAINNCKTIGYQCSILLMLNNWKFPDDYPIKF